MSGKQSYNGTPKCPFRHPMICQKLLRHGDRGRGGCRGKEAGCNEFHQVKMCYSSMNTKKCSNSKDCKNGYHVKGTILTKELKSERPVLKEDFPALPAAAKGPKNPHPNEKEKQQETATSNNSNLGSFLEQLLLQQQEMMQQQQQVRREQMQMQQHVMQLMSRLAGASESRAPSPMMGTMSMPSNFMTTQALRGVGA